MFYYAIIGFILAVISIGWSILGTKFYRQVAISMAVVAIGLFGIVFGWWLHGGITSYDAEQNYYFGEANGYNRGFEAGYSLASENITIVTANNSALYDSGYLDPPEGE